LWQLQRHRRQLQMPPSRRPCCSLPAGPIWRRRQLTRLLPSTTKLRQRLQWQLTKLTLRCCLLLPRLLLLPWKLKTLVRYSPHDEVSLKLCGPYEIIFSGCVHVCKLPGVNGVIQITSSAICAWSDHRCETLTQFLKPAAINPRLVAFTYMRQYRSFSQQYPLSPQAWATRGHLPSWQSVACFCLFSHIQNCKCSIWSQQNTRWSGIHS